MAWSFLNGSARKKRNQMMAVDLGSRTTKAVLLERRGDDLILSRYALVDAPIYDKKISADLLSEHLHTVAQALGATTKFVTLAIGLEDTVVRQLDLPQMAADEMRQLLKMNSKSFLQQDLPNHVFDCHIFPPRPQSAKASEVAKAGGVPKLKVLAAGAKQQLIDNYQMAVRNAGLIPDYIVPGLIGPVNAFERAMPQLFQAEPVGLVDLGFKSSSICILDGGEMVLSRVVNIGGDRLTTGLAEQMSVSYAEAEGIKVGLAPEARDALQTLMMPLGRELRASLDFFEHQQDRPVPHVFVSGGAAKSELFLEMLHAEMIAECKMWNPASFLKIALPGQQAAEIEHVGPQLGVAIGAALAAF
jgi:type IV pilus assembly protein PilM